MRANQTISCSGISASLCPRLGEYALDKFVLARKVVAIVADTRNDGTFQSPVFFRDVRVSSEIIAKQNLVVAVKPLDGHNVKVVAGTVNVDTLGGIRAPSKEKEPLGRFGRLCHRPKGQLHISQPAEFRSNADPIFQASRPSKDVYDWLCRETSYRSASHMLQGQEQFASRLLKASFLGLVVGPPAIALHDHYLCPAGENRRLHKTDSALPI